MAVLPISQSHPSPSLSRHPRLTNLTNSSGGNPVFGVGVGGVGSQWRNWWKKWSKWPQMDFELAAWQLTYLCIAPRRVYRNVYYHKQTKNTWARDDPAMIVLISGCLCLSSFLWTLFYLRPPMTSFPLVWISLSARMILADFLLVGVGVSAALWTLSNRFLTHTSHTHAAEQKVEWAYSFDVHCNSFFPLFLWLYVAQLFLAPVVTRNNWVCLWVGNTIYLVAFTQYIYVTYLGYNALPFLIRSEFLLLPAVLTFILYIISLLGFNFARKAIGHYFWVWLAGGGGLGGSTREGVGGALGGIGGVGGGDGGEVGGG